MKKIKYTPDAADKLRALKMAISQKYVLDSAKKKDNCNVVMGWMPIEEIKNVTIYPEFLKEEIYHIDEPMKHFVSRG